MQTIQKGTNKNFTHMNVPHLSAKNVSNQETIDLGF